MVIDTLQVHHADGWSVVLFRSDDRPQRTVVAVEREVWHPEGTFIDQRCIGHSDHDAEARALFHTAVRSLANPEVSGAEAARWVRALDPELDDDLDVFRAA